jgi:glycosyltransferase involved in cell wall biosynthesis
MKILYVLPYDWGAMPQYTAEIANAISYYAEVIVIGSKGINDGYFSQTVSIVKCFDSFSFSMNNIKKLFSPITLKNFYSFRSLKIIESISPDIIHLTTPIIPPLAIYFTYYGLDKKYPVIYTKHGVVSNSGLKEKILEEYMLGAFEKMIQYQKIIVHTHRDKNEFLKLKNVNKRQIDIIPHGVYSFFKAYGNKFQKERNTILFFGNIREYKGLRYLIKAVPLILAEIPDLKVIIAGDGDISEFSSFLKSKRKVFEIHNEFISDTMVSELFQRSEVVVLPYTKMSGQSGILNVALAYNKPIVASDVGGINEVVETGVNGFLVPPENIDLLAHSIISILKDDKLRYNMEINAHKKSRELSWDNIAKKHIEVYNELIPKPILFSHQ